MLSALLSGLRRLFAGRRRPPATANEPWKAQTASVRGEQSAEALTTLGGDETLALVALRGRVKALEDERVELLMEWQRTREQWIRYLKRQGALRTHQTVERDDLLPSEDGDDDAQLDMDIYRMKLRGSGG